MKSSMKQAVTAKDTGFTAAGDLRASLGGTGGITYSTLAMNVPKARRVKLVSEATPMVIINKNGKQNRCLSNLYWNIVGRSEEVQGNMAGNKES